MDKKPVSGAFAGTDASMEKVEVACWAGSPQEQQRNAARMMAESHVFIMFIHQGLIDDSSESIWRARGIVLIFAEIEALRYLFVSCSGAKESRSNSQGQ
ncbi:MAG: hypothetical protein ABR976_09510 [Terracidiphilus sp.]|jgi:hypothetical protein